MLLLVITAAIIAMLIPVDSDADGGSCGKDALWSFEDGTLTITGSGEMDDYAPGAQPWYSKVSEIVNLNISEGITHIGRYAFQDIMVSGIVIPDSVESVGRYAFQGCESVRSVSIGSGLMSIDGSAFDDSEVLDSLTVSSGNKYLYSYSNVVYLSVNNKPYMVPRGMTNVDIPAEARFTKGYDGGIEDVFFECRKLTSITASSSNTEVRSFNGVLFTKDLSRTVSVPRAKTGSFTIPNATSFASFEGSMLSVITMGSGMPDIGGRQLVLGTAEYPNIYLKTFNVNRAVTNMQWNIGYDVRGNIILFDYCPALEKVNVTGNTVYNGDGKMIYRIDGNYLYTSPKSTAVSVPDGVNRINYHAFKDCLALESVSLSDSVITLDGEAFCNCPVLTRIEYGSGFDCQLSNKIITGCDSLSEFHTDNNTKYYTRPDGAVYIDTAEGETLSYVPPGTSSFTLPDGIVSMNVWAFQNNKNIASIVLSETLLTIADHQFSNCGSLCSINIPSSVQTIGNGSFGSTALVSITIPGSVTAVGSSCFSGCIKLTDIEFLGDSAVLGSSIFLNCTSLTDVDLPSSLGRIEKQSFQGCTSLTDIDIPDSVTYIGGSAFYGCSSLQEAVFPESISEMGESAFSYCTALMRIDMKGGCETIPKGAFSFSGNISSPIELTIPEGTRIIEMNAFHNCRLRTVDIPSTVVSIGQNSFSYSHVGGEISLLGVESIGGSAFAYCNITAVEFSPSLTVIDSAAFRYCTNLTGVSISSHSLTSVGSHAFMNCTGLETVEVDAPNATINRSAFSGSGMKKAIVSADIMENGVFNDCRNLIEAELDVSRIGSDTFGKCSSLREVSLSSRLTKMDGQCFHMCSSLLSIDVSAENEVYFTDGRSLFCNGGKELIAYFHGNEGSSYTIPDSVESFWSNAFTYSPHLRALECGSSVRASEMDYQNFLGCSALSSITISNSNQAMKSLDGAVYSRDMKILLYAPPAVTACNIDSRTETIKLRAFYGCSNLLSVKFPAYLEDIGDSAFYGCTSLTSINLSSVTSIGAKAFYGCTSLSRIVISEAGTISFGNDCFNLGRDTVTVGSSFKEGFLDDYLGDTKANYVSLDMDTGTAVEKARDNIPLVAGGILGASVALIVGEMIIRRRR